MKVSNLELKYMALATQWQIYWLAWVIGALSTEALWAKVIFFICSLVCMFFGSRLEDKAEKESKRLNNLT